MASSSISLPRSWNVFTSFHGPDVRKKFLTHLRKQFASNGISMFDDQRIERSQTIGPALTEAIRGSKISIVVLTKRYASSGWCLDELVEILKCRVGIKQIVITVFYEVDPSDVRKQTGEFGKIFKKTCARRTEEERRRWSQALKDVGNIAGFDFQNWDNEAQKIENIAKDVLDKLNATPSTYFVGMVGLEAHLSKMEYLMDLDNDEVKMVGITGPAGIGKTTIARALQSRLANRFQLTYFEDNLRGSYHNGSDEYGSKLRLQKKFLPKILKHDGLTICHLGAVKENLCDQKVLIILDDVSNLNQLKALANETTWFGPGSRIVVTTENKQLLQNHGINHTYHVEFPSDEQALKILYRYAFEQSYPRNGFEKLAQRVTELCGKLPLGLSVVGSSLLRMDEEWWECVIKRLKTSLDHPDIEQVLRVGFESLHEDVQSLFLHIAVFFNYKEDDLVKDMFADSKLDIKYGLKILVNKCLLYISANGEIVMHKLLQQVGTEVVREVPWKHRILIDASEISHVLEHAKGTRAVSGISFDISGIKELYIGKKAFERMPNLQFFKVYKSRDDGVDRMHIPEGMEFPCPLKLLDWEAYPGRCLPPTFQMECLVELHLLNSKLEYLWTGTKVLSKLKKMDLLGSDNLKELPNLSCCPNLEVLDVTMCLSLVELPSSMENLHKLEELVTDLCQNLEFVPTHFELASLSIVSMVECWELRKFPNISKEIRSFAVSHTILEEVPYSLMHWSALTKLHIYGSVDPLQDSEETYLYLGGTKPDIEKIPDWIKGLQGLEDLRITGCPKLASFSEFPVSLQILTVDTCESLKTIYFPAESQLWGLFFYNCLSLSPEVQTEITYHSWQVCLPGKIMPEDLNHQAEGNNLTIRSDSRIFNVCVMISSKQKMTDEHSKLLCRIHINGCVTELGMDRTIPIIQTEHLFMAYSDLRDRDGWREQENEIVFEFSTTSQEVDIIKCGVEILMDGSISSEGGYESRQEESRGRSNRYGLYQDSEDDDELEEALEDSDKAFDDEEENTYCWSWFTRCFDLSHVASKIGSFGWGTRK